MQEQKPQNCDNDMTKSTSPSNAFYALMLDTCNFCILASMFGTSDFEAEHFDAHNTFTKRYLIAYWTLVSLF
jgi:hypothetical protein